MLHAEGRGCQCRELVAPAPTTFLKTTQALLLTGGLVQNVHPGEEGSGGQSREGQFWGSGEVAQEAEAQNCQSRCVSMLWSPEQPCEGKVHLAAALV